MATTLEKAEALIASAAEGRNLAASFAAGADYAQALGPTLTSLCDSLLAIALLQGERMERARNVDGQLVNMMAALQDAATAPRPDPEPAAYRYDPSIDELFDAVAEVLTAAQHYPAGSPMMRLRDAWQAYMLEAPIAPMIPQPITPASPAGTTLTERDVMLTVLEALAAEVEATTTVEDSAGQLITNIAGQLKAALANNPTDLAAITSTVNDVINNLENHKASLATLVAANTTPPAVTDPPAATSTGAADPAASTTDTPATPQ